MKITITKAVMKAYVTSRFDDAVNDFRSNPSTSNWASLKESMLVYQQFNYLKDDDARVIFDKVSVSHWDEQIVKATPLHRYYVTQVGLSASVVVAADKPAKKIAFSITYPCSCSLKYDGVDLKLRAMLEASGVEPKEPTDEIESDAAVELIAS